MEQLTLPSLMMRWELFALGAIPESAPAAVPVPKGARVIFASSDPERLTRAEKIFRQLIAGETASGRIDAVRLLQYFEARKLFEARCFDSFDQARLDELRENKQVFVGQLFEDLYTSWLATGRTALPDLVSVSAAFSTHVLPHSYEWLSPIRFQERRAGRCPSSRRNQREFEKP